MSKKNPSLIVIICILVLIFILIRRGNKEQESIENNKYETVAQVYKFYSNRSNARYYYTYFYNGKRYRNSENIKNGNREESVNKFYKVYLSIKNPEYSILLLDEEITESKIIKNAGFD